ncbi:MAG TPA: hypothetical protein VMY41_10260 [Thermohalobaculum sp.]|nr:hypothetical protein [Thermohalobaculum sp.]
MILHAPCQAGTVAELSYGGIQLGLMIDPAGEGRIEVPGFKPVTPAVVSFADGSELAFSLRFSSLERIERVAVMWDTPIQLTLNALEFGAAPGATGHVSPDHPRDFHDARRSGGGFMAVYEPVDGVGQHLQVYSYYLKSGGVAGGVELVVDFPSRNLERLAGTCGDGEFASPRLAVLQSVRGKPARPLNRRLSPVGCAEVASLADGLRGDRVADLKVSPR